MRIDGVPNLQKVSQPNQRTDSACPRNKVGRGDDSVEISGPSKDAAGLTEALKAAPETTNPRIGEIRERVQSGYYNSEDIRREIAGAMPDAEGIKPVVNEVAEVRAAHRQLAEVPDVRQDRVAASRQRAAKGSMINPTYARRRRSPSSTSLRKKDCQRSGQPTILGRRMITLRDRSFGRSLFSLRLVFSGR